MQQIAQTPHILGPVRGIGSYGLEYGGDDLALFSGFLTAAIGLLTLVAGIWFIFLLITGAIVWMASGGDKGKIEEAQKRITSGIIGLAVVVAAIFIVEIVGGLLGFQNILNPTNFIPLLSPR